MGINVSERLAHSLMTASSGNCMTLKAKEIPLLSYLLYKSAISLRICSIKYNTISITGLWWVSEFLMLAKLKTSTGATRRLMYFIFCWKFLEPTLDTLQYIISGFWSASFTRFFMYEVSTLSVARIQRSFSIFRMSLEFFGCIQSHSC